jgi:hypothetical protein
MFTFALICSLLCLAVPVSIQIRMWLTWHTTNDRIRQATAPYHARRWAHYLDHLDS